MWVVLCAVLGGDAAAGLPVCLPARWALGCGVVVVMDLDSVDFGM